MLQEAMHSRQDLACNACVLLTQSCEYGMSSRDGELPSLCCLHMELQSVSADSMVADGL